MPVCIGLTSKTTAAPDHSGAVFAQRRRFSCASGRTARCHRRGLVWFVGITAALLAVPLLALLGSPALWVLLALPALCLPGLIWALGRSLRRGAVLEDADPDRTAISPLCADIAGRANRRTGRPIRIGCACNLHPTGRPGARIT